jgi:hypothetical protein
MAIPFQLSVIPVVPGIYALLDRRGRPVYVGMGGNLRQRIEQHLVRRDSSVTTGVAAASLNPDLVAKVRWWTSYEFADPDKLGAAELVAFDLLDPVLRSRGGVSTSARGLAENQDFRQSMTRLFEGEPAGEFVPRTLDTLADLVIRLSKRVGELEERLNTFQQPK